MNPYVDNTVTFRVLLVGYQTAVKRFHRLNGAAYSLGQLVADDVLDRDHVVAALTDAVEPLAGLQLVDGPISRVRFGGRGGRCGPVGDGGGHGV